MEGMFDNVDWQSYALLAVVIVVLNRSDDLAHMTGMPMLDLGSHVDALLEAVGLDHRDENGRLTMVGMLVAILGNVLVLALLRGNLLEGILA